MLVNELVGNLNLLSSGTQPATHLWLYAVVAFVVMLEGPFTILIASSAASTGVLEPIPVFAAASLGNLLADSLWYLLGYYGRLDIVLRWRFLKISPVNIEILKRKDASSCDQNFAGCKNHQWYDCSCVDRNRCCQSTFAEVVSGHILYQPASDRWFCGVGLFYCGKYPEIKPLDQISGIRCFNFVFCCTEHIYSTAHPKTDFSRKYH